MHLSPQFQRQWQRGQLLAFSALDGPTDHAHGLAARTTTTPAGVEITLPAPAKIIFAEEPWDRIEFAADHFTFRTRGGGVIGVFVDAHHLLIEGDCSIKAIDETALGCLVRGQRLLVGTRTCFHRELIVSDIQNVLAERRRWLGQQRDFSHLPDTTQRTLRRALTMMKGQVYSPEGCLRKRWTTPDRWPHQDMWLWDSAFHAVGWRHLDPSLAREMLSAVFDTQRDDGFIAHRMSPEGARSHFTQAPILADAVSRVHAAAPDLEWVTGLFPKLEAYLEWDMANRDTDGAGLLEWFIEEDPVCRSGESGMDNSPRFDSAKPLDAVDFNAFLARDCEALAELAETLGRTTDARRWRAHHARLCQLINERLWSEDVGFYFDYDPEVGRRAAVVSSAGFMPLWCAAPSAEQARRLVAHLADPTMFGTAFPVPSIAAKDLLHYSKDMWRGPVWINVNWLIIQGLERYGLRTEADRLRARTISEIETMCEKYGAFFEYYDDRGETDPTALLRKGICAPENPYRQVIHDFGWTATLYVDLVFGRHS